MKEFDFVLYKNHICILVSFDHKKATIAGINLIGTGDSFFTYEIDVSILELIECNYLVYEESMIYRFKEYLRKGNSFFGFVDEELSLIHPFT